MLPSYLNGFSNSEIDEMVRKGTVTVTTSSVNNTIFLLSNNQSASSSLLSIPIDDIEYSDSQVKNMEYYKINYFETASNFSVKLDGLNQAIL